MLCNWETFLNVRCWQTRGCVLCQWRTRSNSSCIYVEWRLVPVQDSCDVIGYPTGGDNVSVTHGVVSRIEPQPYAHGSTNLLAIQVCSESQA